MDFELLDELMDKIVAQLIVRGPTSIEQLSQLVDSTEYNVLAALRNLIEERRVQALPGGQWMAVGEYKKNSPKP